MEGTSDVVPTRVCPHCRQATRVDWPVCDGCANRLAAYRPGPDLRLVAELERWERANPRPLDLAGFGRRTLAWLWAAVLVASALDVRFGRTIGPQASPWDTLAVAVLVVALLATLAGIVLMAFLARSEEHTSELQSLTIS